MFKFAKKKDDGGVAPSKTAPTTKKGVTYDGVREDALHRENIETAAQARRDWEKNWSFLAKYDSKGRFGICSNVVVKPVVDWYIGNWKSSSIFTSLKGEIKEKEKIPENLSVFADNIPNTSGHLYGHLLRTEVGQTLQKYEFNFYNNNRRVRSADLLLCD